MVKGHMPVVKSWFAVVGTSDFILGPLSLFHFLAPLLLIPEEKAVGMGYGMSA